jgi:protein-disulfide isomerase
MKKLIFTSIIGLFLGFGCQKNNNQLLEQIAKLEKRIELLEQRLKATPPAVKPKEPQAQAFDLPTGESFLWGNPNASITLTQFSDFQCPFCVRAHNELVEKIQEDPELKNKVKIVFKHFPLNFHKNARPASKAALAAGEQGLDCFWKMTKVLYANQSELSKELTATEYKKWAGEVQCEQNGKLASLDVEKFMGDLSKNDQKYDKMIQADMELGSSKAQVRGTPSFFVNGWELKQRNVEAVKQIIKEKNLN